eukprot:gene65151-89133_t
MAARLWDAFFDPLMGIMADRTQTRWGRFRPWVLWTAAPWAVVMVLAYTTPSGWTPSAIRSARCCAAEGGRKAAYGQGRAPTAARASPAADEALRPHVVEKPRQVRIDLGSAAIQRLIPATAMQARATALDMSPEARDRLIDQVLAEILATEDSAFRSDAVLYQDFLVRARMRRLSGPPMALKEFRRRVAVVRSGVDPEMAPSDATTKLFECHW